MEMGDEEEIIMIDMGELGETKFADSIIETALFRGPEQSGAYKLRLNTGVLQREFDCNRVQLPGTYVLYQDDGSLVGKTTTELSFSKKQSFPL